MDTKEASQMIDDFQSHYKYDADYMRDLLKYSPGGFEKYNAFLPMAQYREKAPTDVYYVANIAAMKIEDCGECLQLNIRFALEKGVSKDIVRGAIRDGEGLSGDLKKVYDLAAAVASNGEGIEDLSSQIEAKYGKEVMMELALCIASARVFPALRRTLGYAKSCSLYEFEV